MLNLSVLCQILVILAISRHLFPQGSSRDLKNYKNLTSMTSDFYFTTTSWFLGNVRVKPHSKHSGGSGGVGGEIAHLPQILAWIEAKLSPLKGLILLLDPLDFQTFLWPCSPVNKRLFKSQTALSVFSESKPANLMNFTIFLWWLF